LREELRSREQPPFLQFDGYRVWMQLVDTYSRTQLSRSTDKLIAISALANEARRVLRDDYLAGIWRRQLEWELAWTARRNASLRRPTDYRAPTWSWASVDGDLRYTDYGDDKFLMIDVLEARTTPAGQDDTGAVTGGFIRLRGSLHPVSLANDYTSTQFGFISLTNSAAGAEYSVEAHVNLDVDISALLATGPQQDHYVLLHNSSVSDAMIWRRRHVQRPPKFDLSTLLLRYDRECKT
jgi:hypothetical protein